MAQKAIHSDLSSPDFEDKISLSSDHQEERPPNIAITEDSIKDYVSNILSRLGNDDENQTSLSQSNIKIDTKDKNYRLYENVSAFRQYPSHAQATARTDAPKLQEDIPSDDDVVSDQNLQIL